MEAFDTIACGLAAELLQNFRTLRFRVTGGSMAPALRPGDTIVVQSCGIEEISAGEIVVFKRHGRLVVHRVKSKTVEAGKLHLLTSGDRIRKTDEPVTSAELLGRVCSLEREAVTIHPAAERTLMQKLISRVLGYSNRATSLFLRFAPR